MTDRATRNQRYRNSLCVDCGEKPYSPGRPRCETCHQQHNPPIEPQLTRQPPRKKQ